MSFPIQEVGGYGSGTLNPATFDGTNLNSYARVTAVGADYVVIGEAHNGAYEQFNVGSEILIHVSATTSPTAYLGRWCVGKITAINGSRLTLDTNPTLIIPSADFANYYVQAVTIAQFENLTLSTGTQIRPLNYSGTLFYGGIVALKCSDTLTFDGGHINLNSCGIQVADAGLRKELDQESHITDVKQQAGFENSATLERFMLNVGDGAAWIVAKNLVCHADSRIGNISTYGSHYCRGASDSVGTKPANITNVGGSTILLAAENITDFNPRMFAKYHSTGTTGKGLARCYIATNTKLPNDEGLYAHDVINDSTRVTTAFNIKGYGDGSLGDLSESTVQINNYARITAISADRVKISYTGKTTAGLTQITSGALVMIHQNHKDSTTVADAGRFILAKVLADSGSELTLNTTLPSEFNPSTYLMQVVSIPQCNNFTLSKANAATPKFNGTIGGILAIAVKNHCNLSGGKLNVEKKGGGKAYGSAGLKVIGNSNMSDRLPIGQGHGSVFILAKTLTMDANTRIGATYSGAAYGGAGGGAGGGYKGSTKKSTKGQDGGAGSGATFGSATTSTYRGGYGGNSNGGSPQGAHVLIIADTINGFNQAAISTGGAGGATKGGTAGGNGGAGYGGGGASTHNAGGRGYGAGGGYNGGGGGSKCTTCSNSYGYGGGSSGWAFIYCN